MGTNSTTEEPSSTRDSIHYLLQRSTRGVARLVLGVAAAATAVLLIAATSLVRLRHQAKATESSGRRRGDITWSRVADESATDSSECVGLELQ